MNFLECIKSRQRPVSDIETGAFSTVPTLMGAMSIPGEIVGGHRLGLLRAGVVGVPHRKVGAMEKLGLLNFRIKGKGSRPTRGATRMGGNAVAFGFGLPLKS
jgi:hypothetical protein